MTPSHVRCAVLVVLMALAAGCGPNARDKALKTSLVSLNAAREGFVEWDRQTQETIVEEASSLESGKAALAEHRARRAPVLEAFTVAYSALALAALDDNMARLAEAIDAAAAVYRLVKELR